MTANVMALLNKNQGQLLLSDGSVMQSQDSDLGVTGKIVEHHRNSSGGITKGPASYRMFTCQQNVVVVGPPGGPPPVPVADQGLLGAYYTAWFGGQSATRVDKTLHLPYGGGVMGTPAEWGAFGRLERPFDIPLPGVTPDNCFPLESVKWNGFIKADVSEPFTFHINADDHGWLYLNGKEIKYAWWVWTDIYLPSPAVPMAAGEWVPIEVRNANNPGSGRWNPCQIKMEWSSPSTPRGKIPLANMKVK